jgi:hypothetical protein
MLGYVAEAIICKVTDRQSTLEALRVAKCRNANCFFP